MPCNLAIMLLSISSSKGLIMAFSTLPIRFFVYDPELEDQDDTDPIVEVSEHAFMQSEGVIHYERHTKSQNGVSQVCLTKYPHSMEN